MQKTLIIGTLYLLQLCKHYDNTMYDLHYLKNLQKLQRIFIIHDCEVPQKTAKTGFYIIYCTV